MPTEHPLYTNHVIASLPVANGNTMTRAKTRGYPWRTDPSQFSVKECDEWVEETTKWIGTIMDEIGEPGSKITIPIDQPVSKIREQLTYLLVKGTSIRTQLRSESRRRGLFANSKKSKPDQSILTAITDLHEKLEEFLERILTHKSGKGKELSRMDTGASGTESDAAESFGLIGIALSHATTASSPARTRSNSPILTRCPPHSPALARAALASRAGQPTEWPSVPEEENYF